MKLFGKNSQGKFRRTFQSPISKNFLASQNTYKHHKHVGGVKNYEYAYCHQLNNLKSKRIKGKLEKMLFILRK